MHRIDGPGHLNHRWVAEDPATGRPPTEFTAEYQNASQEELCSLIEWAGIALNKADNTQLRQALLARFSTKEALGNLQGLSVISSSPYQMTTAQLGSAVYFAAGASVCSLPNMKDLPAGSTVYLCANVRTTVNAWADQLIDNRANGRGGAIILEAQDDLTLIWTGVNWLAAAGSLVQRASHESKLDPHPQYTTSDEARQIAGQQITAHRNEADPHPQYTRVAAGEVAFFARVSAPDGFLKANGAAVSRTVYSALFAAIGTTFGAGDGATTFNVPDLRGEFPRGWDDGRGVDRGRTFGSAQTDDFKSHTHSEYSFGNVAPNAFWINAGSAYGNQIQQNTGATGGTETRPRNVALLACIKF